MVKRWDLDILGGWLVGWLWLPVDGVSGSNRDIVRMGVIRMNRIPKGYEEVQFVLHRHVTGNSEFWISIDSVYLAG